MLAVLLSLVLVGAPQPRAPQEPATSAPAPPNETAARLARLARAYFDAADAHGAELRALVAAAAGHEAELEQVLRDKQFVVERTAVQRFARIADGRLVDAPDDNPGLVTGPALPTGLAPLIVYVPDAVFAKPFVAELRAAAERGWFVYLVPDSLRDNRYLSNQAELDRHTGPLRELLLRYPIDPDRVYVVGSGRGGHATWDVGLMRAERFAGIFPCNGGTIHEGGFARTGGAFVENGKDLTIFLVYNTSFDHGIEACRHATELLTGWHTRFEVSVEPSMRVMPIDEAMQKLAGVVRTAHRRTLVKRFNRLPDGSHYWLQALDRRPREWDPAARIELRGVPWPQAPEQQRRVLWQYAQQRCARLAGTVAGNRMRLEVQGIGRLRVWFDPELVAFDANVELEVNGKRVRSVRPVRKLDVMLARVHATGDTACRYWDYVDVDVPK